MRSVSDLADVRIVHFPRNIAGDPQATVDAERALGADSRLVTIDGTGDGLAPDMDLKLEGLSVLMRHLTRVTRGLRAIARRDVAVFEYNSSVIDYPRLGLHLLDMRLPLLWTSCVRAVIFHGSDLRPLDSRWRATYEVSGTNVAWVRRRMELARAHADLLYVKTPDLLHLLPESRWLPQAVHVETTRQQASPERSSAFTIAHAPTRRSLKGTEAIVAAVKGMQTSGLHVDLDLVEGVSHAEVLDRFVAADLVIDQLLVGWYGVTSIEAMALGVPVLCYIDDQLAELVAEMPPVIRAAPETLESVLGRLLESRHELRTSAERGPEYAARVHSPANVARQLLTDALEVMARSRS